MKKLQKMTISPPTQLFNFKKMQKNVESLVYEEGDKEYCDIDDSNIGTSVVNNIFKYRSDQAHQLKAMIKL